MAVKGKWFRAGTAGTSADGREIKDQWLIDIAENYDRKEREASVFLDHIRYYGNYGTVCGVQLRKDEKDRNTLWLQIEPTPDLLDLNRLEQYKYPSLGIIPEFSDTGKAYLGHLGAVQDPASVGIDPINFSNSDGTESKILCFASDEEVMFELEPKEDIPNDEPPWFKRFIKNFSKQAPDMDKKDLEEFNVKVDKLIAAFERLPKTEPTEQPSDSNVDLAAKVKALEAQVAEFQKTEVNDGGSFKKDLEEKYKVLKTQVSEFSTILNDALKASGETQTPPHTGDSDNFSMESLV